MNFLARFKRYILPETIDFFGQLASQSKNTQKIVDELQDFYVHNNSTSTESIFELIDEAKDVRKISLKQLNQAFITPVDKEAITRAYVHLHWIALSIKHLVVEMDTYRIYNLEEYDNLLSNLRDEMKALTGGFTLLNKRKYDDIFEQVSLVIHYDDLLIEAYATHLAVLFQTNDLQHMLQQKEILTQIKEISKRIHFCANQLEDIVFKMN